MTGVVKALPLMVCTDKLTGHVVDVKVNVLVVISTGLVVLG